jgi:hypothetical protein
MRYLYPTIASLPTSCFLPSCQTVQKEIKRKKRKETDFPRTHGLHVMEGSSEEKKVAAAPSSGRRAKTAKGDSNALKRVKKCIEDANFYEALQLIKMLVSRYNIRTSIH